MYTLEEESLVLLSSSNLDLLGYLLVTGNGGISEVVGGGWSVVKKSRRVGGGGDDTLEVGRWNTLYTLEEESLVLLSSSNLDLLELLLVTGNGGISEVVGGGWSVVKKLRRVGGGGDDTLEVGRWNTLYTLEEESLVLLSSSNLDLLEYLLVTGNGGRSEVVGGG